MVRVYRPDPPINDSSTADEVPQAQQSDDESQINSNRGNSSGERIFQERLGPGFALRQSPSRSPRPSFQATDDGALLYQGFLTEQFRRRNLPEPSELLTQEAPYNRIQQPISPELIEAGNRLRLLSDEFAQSPKRQWVEEQAARVPLETLDFNAFSELLYGLFQEGGVTWERVIVLFYFSADLAVRAFREKLPRQFKNIVDWSFLFFSGEQMQRWVAEHGGWVELMQKSVDNVYKIARIGFFAMGMLAFAAYIWKGR